MTKKQLVALGRKLDDAVTDGRWVGEDFGFFATGLVADDLDSELDFRDGDVRRTKAVMRKDVKDSLKHIGKRIATLRAACEKVEAELPAVLERQLRAIDEAQPTPVED